MTRPTSMPAPSPNLTLTCLTAAILTSLYSPTSSTAPRSLQIDFHSCTKENPEIYELFRVCQFALDASADVAGVLKKSVEKNVATTLLAEVGQPGAGFFIIRDNILGMLGRLMANNVGDLKKFGPHATFYIEPASQNLKSSLAEMEAVMEALSSAVAGSAAGEIRMTPDGGPTAKKIRAGFSVIMRGCVKLTRLEIGEVIEGLKAAQAENEDSGSYLNAQIGGGLTMAAGLEFMVEACTRLETVLIEETTAR